MAASTSLSKHVDPEDILHAGTSHRAVMLLSHRIQAADDSCFRRPRIDCFLPRRDHIDASAQALLDMRIDVLDEAEQRDDRDICIAFIQNFVGIIRNLYK